MGVKKNILAGIDGGKFDPDGPVTREQIAVIMDRYTTVIGFKLPEIHTQNTFADNAKIGAWAVSSAKRTQMAGIIQGKTNNFYSPQGTVTRAEVSAVLRGFVVLAVFSDTAQGWVKNDSGQWMFFKDEKALTSCRPWAGKATALTAAAALLLTAGNRTQKANVLPVLRRKCRHWVVVG